MISDRSSLPFSSISAASTDGGISSSAKSKRDTPETIAKAAKEFESLMIGEILKSAREASGSDWLGTDEGEAGSALTDLSEQQLSQALSSGGGLGLAKMIGAGLTKTSSQINNATVPDRGTP